MKKLDARHKIVLSCMSKKTQNSVENLIELANIEDRYTEKEIIEDACNAILDMLELIYYK